MRVRSLIAAMVLMGTAAGCSGELTTASEPAPPAFSQASSEPVEDVVETQTAASDTTGDGARGGSGGFGSGH
jgi:hypothetical protein